MGIVDQKTCSVLYNFSLTDRMLCAGFLEGRVDSCQHCRSTNTPSPLYFLRQGLAKLLNCQAGREVKIFRYQAPGVLR